MSIPVKSPIHKDPIYFAYTANCDKEISVCVCVCSLLCWGSGGIQFLCSILEWISSNSKTYNIAKFFWHHL